MSSIQLPGSVVLQDPAEPLQRTVGSYSFSSLHCPLLRISLFSGIAVTALIHIKHIHKAKQFMGFPRAMVIDDDSSPQLGDTESSKDPQSTGLPATTHYLQVDLLSTFKQKHQSIVCLENNDGCPQRMLINIVSGPQTGHTEIKQKYNRPMATTRLYKTKKMFHNSSVFLEDVLKTKQCPPKRGFLSSHCSSYTVLASAPSATNLGHTVEHLKHSVRISCVVLAAGP